MAVRPLYLTENVQCNISKASSRYTFVLYIFKNRVLLSRVRVYFTAFYDVLINV